MSTSSLTDALKQLKSELRSFAGCLNRANILEDQSAFHGLLEKLNHTSKDKNVLNWEYSLSKAQLKLDSLHVRWPNGPSAFVCVFDLKIDGQIRSGTPAVSAIPAPKAQPQKGAAAQTRADWPEFVLPKHSACWVIDKLAVNIQLLAHSGGEAKWEQFWHFDRHINSNKEAKANQPVEVHPLFHFHFGGDRLAEARAGGEPAWGKLLELHAPRIAHPPLDLVLLIDFLLSNFSGRKWQQMVENEKEYQSVVEAAQRRFWCPYNLALSDYFYSSSKLQEGHLARELWPALACRQG